MSVEHELSSDPASSRAGLLQAQARLACHLLRSTGEGNGVVAPFGAYLALSMLAQGARSDTSIDFDRALGVAGAQRTREIAELRRELAIHDGDPALAAAATLPDQPLIHLASRLVFTDQLEPRSDYVDALAQTFDAPIARLDFEKPAGAGELSRWVRQHTGGLVAESAVPPTSDLVLVIQDVAVLAARWRSPFTAALTADRRFRPGGRGAKRIRGTRVPTMVGSSTAWSLVECEGWVGIRLPYTAGFVADIVLPPTYAVDPSEMDPLLLERLRLALDAASTAASDPARVVLHLPRISLAPPPLDLREAIEAVGLAQLFERPDLSGITTQIPLAISQATAQTRLVMAEAGTVAAAVTEVATRARGVRSGPAVEVHVDRPYLVRIGHERTGLPLFLAVVRDPSAP